MRQGRVKDRVKGRFAPVARKGGRYASAGASEVPQPSEWDKGYQAGLRDAIKRLKEMKQP